MNTDVGTDYVGLQSRSRAGRHSVGLDARASFGAVYSIGVYAKAFGTNPTQGQNIGVYSETDSSGYTFYGVGGSAVLSGTPINLSDESVKTNIEIIENASAILSQLSPKTYDFASPENRPIGFEEGTQYGLIAQEVQEILPDIVHQVRVPEIRDSLGGFIEGTSVELLGVQYGKLIPILIAGFQEQNALISDQADMLTEQEEENDELLSELEELKTQMAEMQNQMTQVMSSFQSTQSKMNNCCGTVPSEKTGSESGAIQLEQNFPNPFDEITTINFSLDRAAQIRLEISDSHGRVLEVLINQSMDAGEYTERWDASAYAPGTYYYSLYADTELLTKKMIKR